MTAPVPEFSIPAGTTAYLTVTFVDKNGDPAAPVSAEYRIDCPMTGDEILATTSLPAQAVVEITLTATDNSMTSLQRTREPRTVTVRATYGADDQVVQDYTYSIDRTAFS